MLNVEFEISLPANKTQQEFFISNLIAQNEAKVGPSQRRELTIAAKADGKLIGGIWGYTHWNYSFVGQLYVAPEFQRKGIGAQLLDRFEGEMCKLKVDHCYLDTFSFQTPEFYLKKGYLKFGELPDYPKGHSRMFFVKKLIPR